MGVKRTELPHAHYTVVRNAWARDRRVTLKAKGLLTYLLSHQVGYDVTQAQIIRDTDDGRASVVSGLEELERAGYLSRTRQRSESGRFAEYDYELADPFDPAGQLLPTSAENPNRRGGNRAENPTSAENPHGAPVLISPPGETAPIEDHSKRTPVPTGQGADDEPTGPTVNQRARQLAQEHYDAVDGMVAFMGVRNVVVAGLQRLNLTDDQCRAVLARLRQGGRPVTLQTFREAATGAPSGRAAPYRDPTDPTAYHQPL